MANAPIRRSYVETEFGQIHVVEAGAGRPVLFLHMTPRSWREYEDVLPIAGERVRAIAMDTVGFGESARLSEPLSIELFATAVVQTLDALELDKVALVGHHTGGVIALEVAARRPDRVEALLLSGTPYVDEARRDLVSRRAPIDLVTVSPGGTHLSGLWAHRRDYYQVGDERFLNNYVADALRVIDYVEEGHVAVNSYRMEERIHHVRARTLLVCGADDGYSRPDLDRLQSALGCGPALVIDSAGVALPEQRPGVFADAVVSFVLGE